LNIEFGCKVVQDRLQQPVLLMSEDMVQLALSRMFNAHLEIINSKQFKNSDMKKHKLY
jgi:hypothetical protein